MREVYFKPDEKIPFLEDLAFRHQYDEDTGLIKRMEMNTEFVIIVFMGILAIAIAISKII